MQTETLRWADRFPELGTGPLPTAPYTSSDYFARERGRIFSRHWLYACRTDDVEEPGSYFVRDLPHIPASIVITRAEDGRIRAFHNVCRHRGNRLADGQGRSRRLTCNYHGWTYAPDGSLVGVPDEDQFVGLDRSKCGLRPVAAETWQGFVFINLQDAPKESLEDFLGPLGRRISDFPYGDMQRVVRFRAELATNWKTAMDIGREGYHIRFVHRATVPDSHAGGDNPYAHLPYFDIIGPHAANSLGVNPNHEPSPAESFVTRFASTVIQRGDAGAGQPACLNPGGAEFWGFDAYFIFPNLGLILGPNWFNADVFIPISVDRTIWEQSFYARPPRNAGERISQEFSSVLSRDLIREDWAQVERVQSGLASGAIGEFHLSDQELLVRHAYRTIDNLVS
ncbi:MAG: aromatic ring-hydroxylating dioxygenase subunit alpha [Gammaproteobacteria bacterium]|nr:aromatic ring-hydroxylating dioxygenase subunit alpha [Gammaproteobacteria bacterium]MDE0367666.1 aromatic ring-hydroxylating dioxygenase subunit alpha [Gammaproteobacteria bacterium]